MAKEKKNPETEEILDKEVEETVDTAELDYKALYEETLKKCEETDDKYKRILAEYDNFKRRTIKEKEAIYKDSVGETIEKLLPLLDNLERALVMECADAEYKKGMELIFKQVQDTFTNLGCEEIKAVGEEFDPELHNAVMHVEDETVSENTIIEQFQKGYKYKDKVLRYSMVKVAN